MYFVLGNPKNYGWYFKETGTGCINLIDKFSDIFLPKMVLRLNSQDTMYSFEEPLAFTAGLSTNHAVSQWLSYMPLSLAFTSKYTYLGYHNTKVTAPYVRQVGKFAIDPSNCGVGGIHHIDNLGLKGMGVAVLYLLEFYLNHEGRKYIHCTINTIQRNNGAGEFLERHGYTIKDTFIGGNSKQLCDLYVKDLFKSPMIKLDWDKLAKL